MHAIQSAFLQCPCCGEQIEIVVDCSAGDQEYIEDCSVCCRPLVITVVTSEGDLVAIKGRPEDE